MPTDAIGCRAKGWARIPIMGVAAIAAASGGKYDKNLDVNHTDWKVEAVGSNLYQPALMILREGGHYSAGRKINNRGTADAECGPMTGNGDEEWGTLRTNDWFLAFKVGILSHVCVSTFGSFGIHTGLNREQEGGAYIRIGTSGKHSAINITRTATGGIVDNVVSDGYQEEKKRIIGEIPDPTFG